MQDNYLKLIELLLPEGVLDYFDVTDTQTSQEGLQIYLEEKNVPPVGYKASDIESKGFYEEVRIQDFPIRHRRAYLCVKRRRWTVLSSGEIISRDWNMVQKGTRMTKEFAAFLKGILR